MTTKEISHFEIYERLLIVEQEIKEVKNGTSEMVAAFEAAKGAFTVLNWLAKAVKPILVLSAFFGSIYYVIINKLPH